MVKDSKSSALAALEITPEQIMIEKTAGTRIKLAKLHKAQKSWLLGYAKLRRKDPFFEGGVVVVALIFRALQLSVFVIVLWTLLTAGSQQIITVFTSSLAVSNVLQFFVRALATQKGEGKLFGAGLSLFYAVLFPLMPFVHILDLYILEKRIGSEDNCIDIKCLESTLSEIAAHEIIPDYYSRSLVKAREELLGESSELRIVERDLAEYLQKLRSDKERLQARLKQADDDCERIDNLQSAVTRVQVREDEMVNALAQHQTVIAKTEAMLDECEEYVKVAFSEKFKDEELIRECDARELGERTAMERARQAQEKHVELLRERVMQLAAIVALPVSELPSANPDGDMRSYFDKLDVMAIKLAELETSKMPT